MSKRSKKIMPVTDVAADTPLAAANEVQEHEEAVAQPAIDAVVPGLDAAPNSEDTQDSSHDDNPAAVSPFVNPMLKKSLTPEQQEKVDNYDRVSDENANLVAENADLKEKIAEYLDELENVKHDLTIANDALVIEKAKHDPSKFVVNVKPNQSSENEKKLVEAEKKISELEREVKSLQDANDKYLMKISDLTFENAKLMSEQQSKALADLTPSITKADPVKITSTAEQPKPLSYPTAHRNVYRPAMNGYADWN